MNRDASNLSTGSAPFELVFWGQISDFPDGSVEHAGWFTRTSRIGLVCTSLGRWCLAPSRARCGWVSVRVHKLCRVFHC